MLQLGAPGKKTAHNLGENEITSIMSLPPELSIISLPPSIESFVSLTAQNRRHALEISGAQPSSISLKIPAAQIV